ncbi:MAG: ATP-binding protein [Bacteroidota bacterium]
MKRSAYKHLLEWKNSNKRKPLVLQGARQVGKTYLVDMFGRAEYNDFIHLNFEQDKDLQSLFNQSLDPDVIINNLSLYIGRKINSVDTLIFFDEIQVAPEVLTSLKYFQEKAPQYHIIAAGSLLGVSVGKESSFPVGKVNFLTLFPMSFKEYLLALGEDLLARKLETIKSPQPLPDAVHNKLLKLQKMYLYLGGMPEVIQDYIEQHDIASVRSIQNEILEAYKRDFSKYTEKGQAIKTSEVWNSIPRQLAKENKKFKYSDVKKNARASMFDQAIEWLHKAGLIHIVNNVQTPKLPLSAYANYSKFKVYLHDVGLLAAELNISSDLIISPSALFSEYNGAFIENFIAQELRYYGYEKLFYWTSKSNAEVDFLLEGDNSIYPVEVKSGMNRNIKSLRSYADKYKPKLLIRISPRNFVQSDDFINIPIYATNTLKTLLS